MSIFKFTLVACSHATDACACMMRIIVVSHFGWFVLGRRISRGAYVIYRNSSASHHQSSAMMRNSFFIEKDTKYKIYKFASTNLEISNTQKNITSD